MKTIIILLLTFLFAISLQSQEAGLKLLSNVEQETDVEKGIMKLNFLPLSFSYEFRVNKEMTMMVEPSFNFNWSTNGLYYFSPTVTVYYRYYYNYEKRNMKGKRTAKNSVNYVGATMIFSFWNAAWSARLGPGIISGILDSVLFGVYSATIKNISVWNQSWPLSPPALQGVPSMMQLLISRLVFGWENNINFCYFLYLLMQSQHWQFQFKEVLFMNISAKQVFKKACFMSNKSDQIDLEHFNYVF